MNFGVVVFPGTWSDCDFHYIVSEVLHQPVRYVWHRDANLGEFDCLILPGGFSYGDYLRAGAVAGRSPVVEALPEFTAEENVMMPMVFAGMNTAEYAVGTLAAVAFAGLLLKVVTSDTVRAALSAIIQRALK